MYQQDQANHVSHAKRRDVSRYQFMLTDGSKCWAGNVRHIRKVAASKSESRHTGKSAKYKYVDYARVAESG